MVLAQSVDEDGVGLAVDVFHHHLEAVETASFWNLDLRAETLGEILKYDSVTCRKKCENMLDEVLLVSVEFLPVLLVLTEINFIDGPEASHLVFVHLPDVLIHNW